MAFFMKKIIVLILSSSRKYILKVILLDFSFCIIIINFKIPFEVLYQENQILSLKIF